MKNYMELKNDRHNLIRCILFVFVFAFYSFIPFFFHSTILRRIEANNISIFDLDISANFIDQIYFVHDKHIIVFKK